MSSGKESLIQVASVSRQALAPGLLPAEPGRSAAEGACLYASILLASTLNRFDLAKARIVGGSGSTGHGAIDVHGDWQGHYWVEATLEDGERFLLDITGDQFGHEPITVLAAADGDSRFRPGPQHEVDIQAASAALELGCADLIGLAIA